MVDIDAANGMAEMPKLINNITARVRDDLEQTITKKSRLRIAAACFSIYAYEELKKSLAGIDELKFIFTSPAFTTGKPEKSSASSIFRASRASRISMALNLKSDFAMS